jgi:hypothetical protein
MMHIKQASKGKAGPGWLVGQGENGSGCNCFLFFWSGWLVWISAFLSFGSRAAAFTYQFVETFSVIL